MQSELLAEVVVEGYEMLTSDLLPRCMAAGLLPHNEPGESLTDAREYLKRMFVTFDTGDITAPLPHHVAMAGIALWMYQHPDEWPDEDSELHHALVLSGIKIIWFLQGILTGISVAQQRATAPASAARRAQGQAKKERIVNLAHKYATKSKRAAALLIANEISLDHEQVRRVLMQYFPGTSWPPKRVVQTDET